MRATQRMTGFAKRTIARFQREIGEACAAYHDKTMRNLNCKILQLDEIWSFTYCKQKNVPQTRIYDETIGDTWTWICLDSETKLIPAWHVGKRDFAAAYWFINDLKARLATRPQITSDGLKIYVEAIENAFGAECDYSQLIKLYGKPGAFGRDNPTEVRYSPPECIGARKKRIIGNPDKALVSTSHIERQNLTLRMQSRRMTRLTNGYSKKLENHKHAMALHFVHYNFARIHHTLRVTPAMAAGVSDHVWSLEEIADLLK